MTSPRRRSSRERRPVVLLTASPGGGAEAVEVTVQGEAGAAGVVNNKISSPAMMTTKKSAVDNKKDASPTCLRRSPRKRAASMNEEDDEESPLNKKQRASPGPLRRSSRDRRPVARLKQDNEEEEDEEYGDENRSKESPRDKKKSPRNKTRRRKSQAPVDAQGRRFRHSLGDIAQDFTTMMMTASNKTVELTEAADRLGIPKRRIYDIVNILDGAGMLKRTSSEGSGSYTWMCGSYSSASSGKKVAKERQTLQDLLEEEDFLNKWIDHYTLAKHSMEDEMEFSPRLLSTFLEEDMSVTLISTPHNCVMHRPHELEGDHRLSLVSRDLTCTTEIQAYLLKFQEPPTLLTPPLAPLACSSSESEEEETCPAWETLNKAVAAAIACMPSSTTTNPGDRAVIMWKT